MGKSRSSLLIILVDIYGAPWNNMAKLTNTVKQETIKLG
ncbi:hypothetical protein D049_5270 [Vibrio parahaemolyticus VPTS-2010]|nr:hypothetical protein D049_5270 [Vibrio parahaemolyticus VPTS-2010]